MVSLLVLDINNQFGNLGLTQENAIGIGLLNWKIKHFGPLDLKIMLVKAIDILPRWGNSSKKILQLKKP
jgi:hypothetical protein